MCADCLTFPLFLRGPCQVAVESGSTLAAHGFGAANSNESSPGLVATYGRYRSIHVGTCIISTQRISAPKYY